MSSRLSCVKMIDNILVTGIHRQYFDMSILVTDIRLANKIVLTAIWNKYLIVAFYATNIMLHRARSIGFWYWLMKNICLTKILTQINRHDRYWTQSISVLVADTETWYSYLCDRVTDSSISQTVSSSLCIQQFGSKILACSLSTEYFDMSKYLYKRSDTYILQSGIGYEYFMSTESLSQQFDHHRPQYLFQQITQRSIHGDTCAQIPSSRYSWVILRTDICRGKTIPVAAIFFYTIPVIISMIAIKIAKS